MRFEAIPHPATAGIVIWDGLQYDVTEQHIHHHVPGYIYLERNDLDYTPEYVSSGVEAITGYHPREYLVDRTITCAQVLHPDDRAPVWEMIQIAVDTQQPYEMEYRIIAKCGELKWVWERGQAIYAEDGSVMYLKGFVMDVSDRRSYRHATADTRPA
ncbi:MAG: PAS domain-containing protein [Alkalinema sp. RL_2_19]|nr:PAS domain-containing protein [Alkalinema sp. RL_2_19]